MELGLRSPCNSSSRNSTFEKIFFGLFDFVQLGVIRMTQRSIFLIGALFLMGAMVSPLTAQVKTKPTTHDLAGRDNCLMCHTPGVMEPVPDTPKSHEGRVNEQCVWCHAPDALMVTVGATQFTHDPAGKENCLMCHTPGVMAPVPDIPAETHDGRVNEQCVWCHTKAGG